MLPYDERGAGEAVVLLHAGIADRSMWAEHLAGLAEAGFRAIAIDLPGFGEAAIRPGTQAPWDDVLQTLRGLGLAQANLVGNSFGAAIALRVAVLAPAAVARLMLISPPPLEAEPSPQLTAAWEAEEEALARGDLDGAVDAVLDAWLQPDAPTALRARIATMQRRAFELQRGADQVEEAPDPLEGRPERLADVRCPVLAVAGEGDMPDFQHGAEAIARHVPRGRHALMPGVGHLAPLEAPDALRTLLLDFLREPAGPH